MVSAIKGRVRYSGAKTRVASKPNLINTGVVVPWVAHEGGFGWYPPPKPCKIREFAAKNKINQTQAEHKFKQIVLSIPYFKLDINVKFQHVVSGKWIVDAFFPDVRLAVEIDGMVHSIKNQKQRDELKFVDLKNLDITLIRMDNRFVLFRGRERIVQELRRGWRMAKARKNRVIGLSYEEASRALTQMKRE